MFKPSVALADTAPAVRSRPSHFPRRIGILNDYVRIPYANGSSFASQLLYRAFTERGHDVVVVGPEDPLATDRDMPRDYLLLPSLPLRNHPGVYLPFPSARGLSSLRASNLAITVAQTNSGLLDLGVWLRLTQRVPLLAVNTIHLPSVYNVLLPDSLNRQPFANGIFSRHLIPFAEQNVVSAFNRGDGLVVLSRGLEQYWRDRGVTVPIFVIPRCIDPDIFDRTEGPDPFDPRAPRGTRLLVVCRHTREKGLEQLLSTFARVMLPAVPAATLTLVGDGPDHDAFKELASRLGVAARCFFTGEVALESVPSYYANADLFVYTSLSETYGQVIGEAMWCGLPVVALDDGMGVAHQVVSGKTGVLVSPGASASSESARFGREVVSLLLDRPRLRAYGEAARRVTRTRNSRQRSVASYYEAFAEARAHLETTLPRPDHGAATAHLARWSTIHAFVAGLGCLRAPADLNKNGTKPAPWDLARPAPTFEGVRRIAGARTADPDAA